MKIRSLIIISTICLGVGLQSCEKDEVSPVNSTNSTVNKTKQNNSKSSYAIIDNINSDIANEVNYEGVVNEYDYSGDYLLSTLRDIYSQNPTAYQDENFLFDEMEENLIEYGYSLSEINTLLTDIQDVEDQENTVQEVIYLENSDQPNSDLQLELFSDMVSHIQIVTSLEEMNRISNIYTYHINQSSTLTTKEKKDLLTVTSDMVAITDFADESNWTNSLNATSSSDPNHINNVATACSCGPSGKLCATSFMVPFLSGAAMGNGAGAVVGFFAGMATAYGNGCMD